MIRAVGPFSLALLLIACASDLPDPRSFPPRSATIFDPKRCGAAVRPATVHYPPAAQEEGIEGWVMVSGLIDPAGGVRQPIVLAAEPEDVFDRAALDAFSRSRFCAPDPPDSAPELRTVIRFRLIRHYLEE